MKIEQGDLPPPSESVVTRLAAEIGEDADTLLAMAGKVSRDLQARSSGGARESSHSSSGS